MHRKTMLAFCTIALVLACTNMAFAQTVASTPAQQLRSSIERQTQVIANLKRGIDRLSHKVKWIDQELSLIAAIESHSGVSAEAFPEVIKNLQARRIDLLIDSAGLEAKREAILKVEKAKPDKTAIIEPLAKIVKLKEAKLKQIHKSSSNESASQDEIRSAEMDLLSSKVQLANAKSKQSSSSLLSDSLLSTSLALAESKARLAKTEELLAEVLPARMKLDQGKILREQANQIAQEEALRTSAYREAKEELKRLKDELKQLENNEH